MNGVLVDAGAVVALLDEGDGFHDLSVVAFAGIRDPLYSVWPVMAEAMHVLRAAPVAQEALCDMVDDGILGLLPLDRSDVARVKELMRKYRDLPMDFADAALVRVAERDDVRRIVTFDRHFRVYHLPRRSRFTVLPA